MNSFMEMINPQQAEVLHNDDNVFSDSEDSDNDIENVNNSININEMILR